MNKNQSQSQNMTNCSQNNSQSCQSQIKTKIYRIAVQTIFTQGAKIKTPQMIYLNLKLKGEQERTIQTPCLDISSDKKHFMIRSQADVQKIQVVDYDSMKKLSKISLKGINKQFSYTHLQERSSLKIALQMSFDKVELLQKKSKLVESVIYQCKHQSDLDTDQSETQSIC